MSKYCYLPVNWIRNQWSPVRWIRIIVALAFILATKSACEAALIVWIPVDSQTSTAQTDPQITTAMIVPAPPQIPLWAAERPTRPANRQLDRDGSPLSIGTTSIGTMDGSVGDGSTGEVSHQKLQLPLPPHELLNDARLTRMEVDEIETSSPLEQYRTYLRSLDAMDATHPGN